MNITVEIACDDNKWLDYKDEINKIKIAKVVTEILNRYDNLKKIKNVELSILLTDHTKMKLLNSQFRNKDRATNVLSFPDLEINWHSILEFKPDLQYMYLGDIAFGYDIIVNEARDSGKNFLDHFTHLLVHAILHLIGYDHDSDEAAEVMEALEVDILKQFSIDSPY